MTQKSALKWKAILSLSLLSIVAVAVVAAVTDLGLAEKQGAADSARGAGLYAENCASCHGANLEGQPDWQSPGEDGVLPAPPHDRTGHTWHHGDQMLFDYTKAGGQEALALMGVTNVASGMPGFADSLSDQDIRDILAFIRSSWPEREQELQRQRTLAEQLKGN